jgi:hypothetical protein
MNKFKTLNINGLCNNIVELNNNKYVFSMKNSIGVINKETESIENQITLNESSVNRIIQLKNNNIATCSDDGFITIYSINFQIIQTIKSLVKLLILLSYLMENYYLLMLIKE